MKATIEGLDESVESVRSKPKKKAKKKKTSSKKKKKVIDNDIASVFVSNNNEDSSIKDELLKITNVKSKEQIKKPKKIVFMASIYLLIGLSLLVFCLIRFSKSDKISIAENIYEDTKSTDDDFYIEETKILLDNINVDEESQDGAIEIVEKSETTKKQLEAKKESIKVQQKETLKIQLNETSNSENNNSLVSEEKDIDKIEETTKAQQKDTISAMIFSKAQSKKNAQNEKISALNKILPKYDTELYSMATYYQYNIDEIKEAFSQLADHYRRVENRIWGDISFEDKGTNGKIYLNYKNMKDYLDKVTDLDRSKYATLLEVQTTIEPVVFDFENAKDMGIYYEIPANTSKSKLNLMVLKGAKIAFSQNLSLTTTLEILDIEWNTRHNPYFAIEDVVGINPKAKSLLVGTSFKIDEMLKNTKFSNIIYDKKGYITDILYFQ